MKVAFISTESNIMGWLNPEKTLRQEKNELKNTTKN